MSTSWIDFGGGGGGGGVGSGVATQAFQLTAGCTTASPVSGFTTDHYHHHQALCYVAKPMLATSVVLLYSIWEGRGEGHAKAQCSSR